VIAAPTTSTASTADPEKLAAANTTSPKIKSRPAHLGNTPARIVAMPNMIKPIANARPPSRESAPDRPAPVTASTSAPEAPAILGGVERYQGENEQNVRGEHRARSEHRAVFRIAAEVEDMTEQQ
jgi:hypothetical protein